MTRLDIRLRNFIENASRGAYCWRAHDPCPFGLPKHRSLLRRLLDLVRA